MKYPLAFPFPASTMSAGSTEPLPSFGVQRTFLRFAFALNPQYDTLFTDLIPEAPWYATTAQELPGMQAPSAVHVDNIAATFSGRSNRSYSRDSYGFSRNGSGGSSYHHDNGNSGSNGNGNGNGWHGGNGGNGGNGDSYQRQNPDSRGYQYRHKDGGPTLQIVRHIGVVHVNPRSGWRLELNVVSWNYGPAKYDIREWSPDHKSMGRGITLDEGKFINLFAVITSEIENFVGADTASAQAPQSQASAVVQEYAPTFAAATPVNVAAAATQTITAPHPVAANVTVKQGSITATSSH